MILFLRHSANPMCPQHNDTVEPSNNNQQPQQKRSQKKDENSSLFGSEDM